MRTFSAKRLSGFSLIEVTMAVGITGFCLLAIFGLLPVALKSNQSAIEQTSSTAILSAIISDLRATPSTNPPGGATVSEQYGLKIPASDGTKATQTTLFFTTERTFAMAQASDSRYRVTVDFLTTPGGRGATQAMIKVYWPAAASVTNAVGSTRMFVALDRN